MNTILNIEDLRKQFQVAKGNQEVLIQLLSKVEYALESKSKNLPLLLLKGNILEGLKKFKEAYIYYKSLVEINPHWRVFLKLIDSSILFQQEKESFFYLGKALRKGMPEEELKNKKLFLELLFCKKNLSCLEQNEKQNFKKIFMDYGTKAYSANNIEHTLHVVELLIDLDRTILFAKQLPTMLQEKIDEDSIENFLMKQCLKYPSHSPLLHLLESFLYNNGRSKNCLIDFFVVNKENIQKKDFILIAECRFPLEFNQYIEESFSFIHKESKFEYKLKALRYFKKTGEKEKFDALFVSCAKNIQIRLKLLLSVEEGAELKGHPLEDIDKYEEYRVVPVSESSDVLVVFGDVFNRFAGMPFKVFDRLLATKNISIIYLKDIKNRLLFLNGISSLAPSYEATIKKLAQMIQKLGATNVYTLSTSGGGIGAMRYGIDLGAKGALCFSPPSNVTVEFLKEDPRGAAFVRRLTSVVPPAECDILPYLKATTHPFFVNILYCKDSLLDKRHAEYLSKIPQVSLHTLKCSDHDSFAYALSEKSFTELINHYLLEV
jgi:hypothetical protein